MMRAGGSLLAALCLAATASAAGAADLLRGASYKDETYASHSTLDRHVYVRVDGAYSVFADPTIRENENRYLNSSQIDDGFGLGGGIGLYFGRGVRFDATYDRLFESDVSGVNPDRVTNAEVGGTRKFGLASDVFLANLYYDFNRHGRFNPYLGLGLGVVRHETTAGSVANCNCDTSTITGADAWNVAGAFMAGFDMGLMRGLRLDAGYRFLYLGTADIGSIVGVTGGTTFVASNGPRVDEINTHQFRLGLRYDVY